MVINLPKLGPVQFRDDITPQEFQAQLSALSEKYGFELPRPEYGIMESFTRGVSRGATRLGSLATDVIPAMIGSAVGAEDYARRQMEEAEEVNRRLQEENAPGFTSFRQIEGPTDFLKYAAETLGETTPDILGIIGTGGVGGLAGRAIAKKGAQEFAEREAKRRVLPGGLAPAELAAREAGARATGQGVGVYLGSYAVNAPDVFQNIFEETGSLEPGAAALFGAAVAALDAILPKQILDSMNNTAKLSVAEKVLERSGMAPGLLRKVAAVVPATAAREGLTEVGQEAISLAAVKFVDENYDLFTSENFERLLESGVRGAVAGGGFGTLQAGGERLRERGVERAEREAEEARLAREEALRGTQIPLPGMEPPTFEEEPTIGRTQYAGELTDIERRAKLGEYPLTEPEPVEEARVKPPKEQLSLFDKKGQPTKYAIETVKSAQKLVNEQAKRTPEKTPLGRTIAKAKAELDKLATNIEQASQKEVLETLSAVPRDLLTLAQRTAAPTETVPESVLTADRLKETGLSPRSGIFKRLVGKDIIADNAAIRAEIETAAANPNLAKSTITALQELEGRVPLELTAPTEESLAARALPEAEAAAAETGVPRAQRAFDFDTAPARAEPAAPESTEVITPEAVVPEVVAPEVVPEPVAPVAQAAPEILPPPAAPEAVPEPAPAEPDPLAPLRTQATSLAARLDRRFGRGEGATLREIAQDSTIDAESLAAEIELAQQTLEEEAPAVQRKPAVKEEVEEAVRVSRDLEAPIDEEIPTADVAIGPESEFAGEREAAEIDEISAAKQKVGEELSKLVSAIGAKHNLTPEEQGSLGDFMSALGDLMVAYIKAGAKNFGEAMARARKRARRDLGKNAQYVPETAYKKAYDEAKKIVVKEEKATPKAAEKQRKSLAEAINNIGNTPFERFPKPTPQMMDGALNALSRVPDTLRRAYMGFLSLYQINDLFGSRLPSLKNLIKGLEQRASDAGNRREVIDRNMNKFYKVLNKYSLETRTRFNNIALDTTVTQVDPLTVAIDPRTGERTYSFKPQPQVANAQLVRQFYTLPKELQDVYVELRREYDKYGDELLDSITKNVTPSAAQKLRTEFESKRLKVYLPLWRHGEYWLSYTDKNNEPVVMAFNSPRERQQEISRAKADGAVDLQEFSRLDQISASQGRGAPPTGFTAKIIAEMKKANVSDDLIDTVYTSYLSLFPADSVRQMFRTRKNVEGFEKDVVQAYANVASRMANQLSRIKYADQIDEAMNAVRGEAGDKTDQVMQDVIQNINAQESFLRDPTPHNLASLASLFSYFMFIAGNISSAVVNLTQLPIVVYSLLGGEYGFDNAASAMQKAMSMYFNGGKDTNSQFLPDFTFGATAKGRYKTLYDTAVARSAIRRSTAYELVDMRKQKAEDYTGMWAKTKQILGWTFQNSERMNREVTLIAAFDLAYDKLTKQGVPEALAVDQAIEKAIDVTNRSHGASLAETGPRLFQDNIGKVIFTFKRFAQAQLYLVGRLFNDALRGADPEVRNIARRQLLGVYGMAFMFAGAQGIPLYGAGTMLAGFLLGDDDEPVDVDELLKQSIGSMAYKGPVSSLLNIDIAGRTGFNGLLWRDDPRRIAEVGPVTYSFEQLAGPAYGAFMNVQRGYELFGRGEVYRGFEAMLPSFLKNGMKGIRFASEGATNLRGVPIIEDVNAYNVLMQLAGFTPTDLSEAYARAGAKKEVERKILQRRNSLLTEYDIARVNKDREGMRQIREEMRAFSRAHPQQGVRITPETLERSYRERRRAEKEMVDGVRLNRGLRKELEEKYGPD